MNQLKQYYARIDRSNSILNSMNYVTDWSTLSKQIGAQKGILQDFPIAIKDNICTLEGTTTCASRILQGYKSPFEAAVVRKLKKQGALMIGKTNMDEFGMGSFTVNTFNGPCINPKDSNIKRAAGGSSGGSAVAVAANFCFAAIGSDTGGSVRLPAAYCGVVGFKPSYGRISRYGLITYAHSLDTIGIFSQTVKDASLIYEVIKGKDDCDPTSVDFHDIKINPDPGCDTLLKGITIGIPSEYYVEGLSDEVLNTWNDAIYRLEKLGAVIKSVSLPNTANALSAYYIIAPAEAYSNLAKYDGVRYGIHIPRHESDPSFCTSTRTLGFGTEVKRRLMVGAHVLKSQDYLIKAQQVRALVRQDFDLVFNKKNTSSGYIPSSANTVDALLTPASMTSAPSLDQVLKKKINPYVNDVFTIPSSLAGLPAIVIPCKKDPLPIGLQLISQYGDDDLLLFIASKME